MNKLRDWIRERRRETAFLWEHEKEHLEMAIPHFKAFLLLMLLMGLLVIASYLITIAINNNIVQFFIQSIIFLTIGLLIASLYIDRMNHRNEIATLKKKYNYNHVLTPPP